MRRNILIFERAPPWSFSQIGNIWDR